MSEVRSWPLSDGYLVGDGVGDSLAGELSGLDEGVRLYDFDRMVREMAPDAVPKSVDCLALDEGWVFLIEFKRMPGKGDPRKREVLESIKLKAVESLHLCGRFLPEAMEGRRTFLIVVEQDPAAEITDMLTLPDGSFNVPGYLGRYMGTDVSGERMFFDQVASMHSRTFTGFANRRFVTSDVRIR